MKKREDGLNVHNMNQEYGGKVPDMLQALLDAYCLGVHNPLIEAGGIKDLLYLGCDTSGIVPADGGTI